MTKAIGYIRVSTQEQSTTGVSLQAQEEKLKAYAGLYDIELVDIIVDAGESAKTLDRPGLQTALRMLDNGEAEALLICKLDRLTRSVRDLDTLLEHYFSERFSLMSIGEQIDTRTASGRLVLNVLMSVSQWEREAIGERTKEALSHKKSIGEHCGGVGFGYQVAEKRLARTKEHETVQGIIKMRREGLTLTAIANNLNSERVETQRGGKWYAKTVSNIIKREESMRMS
jgi:DNA invertase Pin-like site-specific DNA recombinase